MIANLNLNTPLAGSVRRVNALWSQLGKPDVAELRTLWLALERNLDSARVSGDEARGRRAIAKWQTEAMDLIEEAVR